MQNHDALYRRFLELCGAASTLPDEVKFDRFQDLWVKYLQSNKVPEVPKFLSQFRRSYARYQVE